jgi:hypothetical protein
VALLNRKRGATENTKYAYMRELYYIYSTRQISSSKTQNATEDTRNLAIDLLIIENGVIEARIYMHEFGY